MFSLSTWIGKFFETLAKRRCIKNGAVWVFCSFSWVGPVLSWTGLFINSHSAWPTYPCQAFYRLTGEHLKPSAIGARVVRNSSNGSTLLPKNIIPQNCHERRHPIFPTNLLPLFVGAPLITNGHLVNPPAFLRHLGGEFRFKTEPV